MKKFFYMRLSICTLVFFAHISFGQERIYEQLKFERTQLERSSHVINQPKKVDRTDEYGTSYEPKPKVVEVNSELGRYEYRWTGLDGIEKIVTYQRPDAIKAIVAANSQRDQELKFVYQYKVDILSSSPIRFRNFIVQTFGGSLDISGLDNEIIYAGQMYPVGYFKEGIWRNWAYVGSGQQMILSGDSIVFKLSSESPPGIVGCRAAGGEFGSIAADEEMPGELEDEMPVNEVLATGYTIGPDERLLRFSDSEKIKYLLENLAKFQEAGWMSEGTAKNYEQILKKNDLSAVLPKAKDDFEKEFIAIEVLQIIEGLTQKTL